jgi:alkyldihydroxyacetonephosphate synthase
MVIDELRRVLGADKVLTDEASRAGRRRDSWVPSQLADADRSGEPLPCCVVRPSTLSDVIDVVNVCRAARAPLVPFGLGSGVCGGVLVSADSVVLDMGAMNRVREIDTHNLTASFDAGVRGSDAEAQVQARGLMLGHYPQSIGISSVGGWVATRAAGQFSTAYGSIEDIILSLEAVLPNGEVIETRRTPRASSGPDLRHLLLGSEGTLGVVTGVTLSVRRLPEKRTGAAFFVRSMDDGFAVQREILQRGFQPPVLRQYDAVESERMFGAYARSGDGLLVVVHEGPAARVDAEVAGVAGIAAQMGAEPASAKAADHWLAERNHVPTFGQFFENGIVLDTIEIAALWDKVGPIYRAAIAALGAVPGILTASAHSSHGYRSGLNLYFTFVARPEERSDMKATYLECWRSVMRATVEGGGGISHHHGIGRIRREWLRSELGDGGVALLRTVKQALDPDGFMNPGVLIPEERTNDE